MNPYETRRLLDEYLLFHYGTEEQVLPWAFGPREALNFAVRSVSDLLDVSKVPADAAALDLGCAVGRSCYELARIAERVVGIDYSHAFIDHAKRVLAGEATCCSRLEEASLESVVEVRRPFDPGPGRVFFQQGDAMNLPTVLGEFDIVHAANLLCRLTHPQRLLQRLPDLVKPGGQLLLTTPCTWLAEFTPPENWPAGSTREWLRAALLPHFDLAHEIDLPFLIREHARKYQWSVAYGTRWVRR
jgi:putative 4-mercaptohistidine N1-methyltranferase